MPRPISQDKKQEWETKIGEQQESGLSINEWCLQNQVTKASFHYWKEKLNPKKLQKNSFTELSFKKSNAISLQACGISMRISSECDPHLRKQLFALFAEAAC